VLLALDDAGLIEGRTLQEIADAIGQHNHRATIMKDLRLLPKLRHARSRALTRLQRSKAVL
jgi:hypothetical protein